MRHVTIGLIVAVALLVGAGTAVAANPPGVHVDPNSPAGRQYAFPISSARSETAGQTGSQAGSNAPAFGVGITPSGSSASSTSPTARARVTRPAHRRTRRRTKLAASQTSGGPTSGSGGGSLPVSASTASTAGSGGWVALVIGGALVLVLGGAGGFALRRRLS